MRTAKNIGFPKTFLKKTFWEISGGEGVYLNILDQAFFDLGTIRGLLLVYAANVPVFFYMAVGAHKALKLGEMRGQK